MDIRHKKVIGIGTVKELTGLTERQIRYYEEKKLLFPERTAGGTRKYSFEDVERLVEIAAKIEDGWRIQDIKEKERRLSQRQRDEMIRGQINAAFKVFPSK